MENNSQTKIDLDSIVEFPPSYKNQEKSNNNNNPNNNLINSNKNIIPEEKDDFEEFAENFIKSASIINNNNNTNKNLNQNSSLKEINLENNKQLSFKFREKEFNFVFLSYTNLNFLLLSENKKIGNLYTAEVEEPEFQIEPDSEVEMLPPEYEVKCILGNRFDNLNAYFSNFISSNFFNFCQKANKALHEKPKFFYNEDGMDNNNNNEKKEIDIFLNEKKFYENQNSFFHKAVRNMNSLLVSLDFKIENVCNEKFFENQKNNKKEETVDLDKIIGLDEFELAEITSDFSKLLREQILNILN